MDQTKIIAKLNLLSDWFDSELDALQDLKHEFDSFNNTLKSECDACDDLFNRELNKKLTEENKKNHMPNY